MGGGAAGPQVPGQGMEPSLRGLKMSAVAQTWAAGTAWTGRELRPAFELGPCDVYKGSCWFGSKFWENY